MLANIKALFNLDQSSESLFFLLKAGISVGVIYGLIKFYRYKKRLNKRKNYPKDVVIFHHFGPGLRAPSPSPFPLKLETWMRMADIKYKNDYTMELSPKGKIPWITYNGVDVSDSEFCIQFLMKNFNKDLSEHLTPVEKSIARAFLKLNEESMRWAGVVHRLKYGAPEDVGIPRLMFYIIGRKILKETVGQGYGRHSKEEIYEIGIKDLKAIEDFIGNKKFLMGDKICNEDASLFGMLCQLIYHDKGPFNEYAMNNCPNVLRYVDTIKSIYWSDWNTKIREKSKN